MNMLLLILLYLATVVGMEFWSAFAHRTIYHGFLWRWHKSHHRPRTGSFEKNDLFPVLHAVIVAPILIAALHMGWTLVAVIAAGVTTFGILYALFHDGFIHERLPLGFLARVAVFRKIREDHLYHHTGDPNAHFGLFFWNRTPARVRHIRR